MTSPPIRVETVPVRRTGRWPVVIAALAVTLVAASILKPWGGAGSDPSDGTLALPSPTAGAADAADNG